ncbi:tetratricopeptide repeat protein [Bradyrhizobium manausense]|uniref:O-linked N-acetylglucosamine transferase, SPINDLY family protein n=1 Tax=Bradyrhizobium manausense TaxID=989370 RepID=UPI001BA8BBB0|nr:tetratricopeptide repeat protein [Bradyrhizobium manausense]MBR1091492.1 tetratricopeptide repeat protein [Bradyrhizobium manausense]
MKATAKQDARGAPPEAETALFEAFQHHQAGRLDAAVGRYRDAIAIHPDFPEALNNLGIALKDQNRFSAAVTEYRKALVLRPDLAQIWNNLGDSLHSLGDRASAIAHYRKAVALQPDYATAWRNLGDCLAETGVLDEAQQCFDRALALDSSLDASSSPAEIALREIQRQFSKMVTTIEATTARDPRLAEAYLACGRDERPPAGCDPDTAERFRFAAQLRASFSDHLSSMLLQMHYDREFAPGMLREGPREVARFHAQTPRFSGWQNLRDPERRLRIGYVSADFRTHSVGYFLSAILLNHDDASVETICYSGTTDEDEQTAFFRSRAAHWRSTIGIDDRELAARIRADAIDILVDLSGHTYGHRLGVFARKPAPLQVTWLGYPDTTGLSDIDYRLTDAIVDPPGTADTTSSERLFRLPDGFHCYTAPVAAPDVSKLPAERNGFVTFGSFNNLVKVNHQVLDAWAGVLQRVAGSHLVLKSKWLVDAEMRKRIERLFEQRGIARDRLKLIGKLPTMADHLAAYGEVDIALDTFPYNGATTTCEALWMGVPVVTLAGDRHAARVGASMLSRVGLQDIVTERSQDYVAAAARLAADVPALAALRASLRERVAASPLCDGPRFTHQLEAAYRTMWREWCATGVTGNG